MESMMKLKRPIVDRLLFFQGSIIFFVGSHTNLSSSCSKMTSVETELVIPAALMEAGEAVHHDGLAEPFVEEHPPVAAASSSSGAQDPEEAARAQDKTKNLLIGMALPESDIPIRDRKS